MGKRVRQGFPSLPTEQSGAVLALSLAFLVGGLLGLLFVGLADGAGARELETYLRDYLHLVQEGRQPGLFRAALRTRWGELLPVLLLGLTPLGVVGIPAVLGYRGFQLAFSAACFCRVFGGAGLLPAFVLFGVPALIWCPVLFLAGSRALCRAAGSQGSRAVHWAGLCLFLTLMFLCAVLEHTAVPVLLRGAARFAVS